jgi:hypothetical protein
MLRNTRCNCGCPQAPNVRVTRDEETAEPKTERLCNPCAKKHTLGWEAAQYGSGPSNAVNWEAVRAARARAKAGRGIEG